MNNFTRYVKKFVAISAIICFTASGFPTSYAIGNIPDSKDTSSEDPTEVYSKMGQLEQSYAMQANTLDESFACMAYDCGKQAGIGIVNG